MAGSYIHLHALIAVLVLQIFLFLMLNISFLVDEFIIFIVPFRNWENFKEVYGRLIINSFEVQP